MELQRVAKAASCDDLKSRLDQYKYYSPKYLRQRLKEKIYQGRKIKADTTGVFASVLFADISGFTQLSSRLNEEELKTHINEYFTKLLGIVQVNSGDVVKFCGDAVLIMWAVPLSASAEAKAAAVLMSAVCALQLIEECGDYRRSRGTTSTGPSAHHHPRSSVGYNGTDRLAQSLSPPKFETIELSLHCGISCGEVNCMTLGDTQRLEFLLSGDVIHQMGAAEGCAKVGEVCLHPCAYAMIQDTLHGDAVFPSVTVPTAPTVPAVDDPQVGNPLSSAAALSTISPVAAPSPVEALVQPCDLEVQPLAAHSPVLSECLAAVAAVKSTSEEISAVLGSVAADSPRVPYSPTARHTSAEDTTCGTLEPIQPVAFRLTGRLAECFVLARAEEQRLKRARYAAKSQRQEASPGRDPHDHNVDLSETASPSSPELSPAGAAGADNAEGSVLGVSADTVMYLQTLVREISACKPRPLMRAQARLTASEVKSFVAENNLNHSTPLPGASVCLGVDHVIDEDAELGSLNNAPLVAHSPKSLPGTKKREGSMFGGAFLSRFRSSKLRSSSTDSLSSDQNAVANAGAVTSESSPEGTQSTSFANLSLSLNSRQSFFFTSQSSTRTPTAFAARQNSRGPRALPRQSQKYFSALFSTNSSLGMLLPRTVSGLSAVQALGHTRSECSSAFAVDVTGDCVGELSVHVCTPHGHRGSLGARAAVADGVSELQGPASSSNESLHSLQRQEQSPLGSPPRDGHARTAEEDALRSSTEDLFSTTVQQDTSRPSASADADAGNDKKEEPSAPLAAREQRLSVAMLKHKLKFTTAPGILAVRAFQDNWDHGAGLSQPVSRSADNGSFLSPSVPEASSFSLVHAPSNSEEIASKRTRLAQELRKFIHETAVRAIDSNTVTFLSELRDVAVVFTQILDLENDFIEGLHARPQKVFCVLLKSLRQFGGSLRQFVVDDKGCVAIACFGLAGSSNQNNCVQAVEYAVTVRTLLHSLGCRTATGITLGRVYCGIVGAGTRCEYAVMGSSVNLAARLMAACALSIRESEHEQTSLDGHGRHYGASTSRGVMVDSAVHHMAHHLFQFQQLTHIKAKGYAEPVKVFAAIRKKTGYKNFNSAAQSYLSSQQSSLSVSNAKALASPPSSPLGSPSNASGNGFAAGGSSVTSSRASVSVSQCAPLPLLEREEATRYVVDCLLHGQSNSDASQPNTLSSVNHAPFTISAASCAQNVSETVSVPHSVFIQGPVGVGRSRFLCHVVDTLLASTVSSSPPGGSVALLQCDPANQYVPFDLVRAILYKVFGVCELDESVEDCGTQTASGEQSCALSALQSHSFDEHSTRTNSVLTINSSAGPLSLQASARSSQPIGRRRTLANPSSVAVGGSGTIARRHSSAGAGAPPSSAAGRRRSLGHAPHSARTLGAQCKSPMSSIAEGSALESAQLRGFVARRLLSGHMLAEDSTHTASSDSAASSMVSAADCDPHLNAKIVTWSAAHLPPSLTIAAAFQMCYPALTLCDVLQFQYLQCGASNSTEDSIGEAHLQALEAVCALPVAHFMPLLNDLLGCSLSYPADSPHSLLSADMQEVLMEVLLQTLVLAALGCLRCSVGDTAVPTPCAPGWIVAVDDLQHADAESVLLISKVLTHLESVCVAVAPTPCNRGAFLLTCCDAAALSGGITTHSASVTSPHPVHCRRTSFLCSSTQATAAAPEDLFSQRNLHNEELFSHEKLMALVHRHCKMVTLPKLSASAVRALTIQVMGLRRWMYLMNNADVALGVTTVPSGRKASAVPSHMRRVSMVSTPSHSRMGGAVSNTCLSPQNRSSGASDVNSAVNSLSSTSLKRRNGVSSTPNTCNVALMRLMGSRCASEARLNVSGHPTQSPRSEVAGIAMAAAGAAAAHHSMFHPLCSEDQQDHILGLLYTHSQHGVPGSVLEIACSLRDSIAAGTFRGIPHLPVILQRNKLILEVLDNLGGMEVAVLKAASVIGSQFEVSLLAATLAGMELSQCALPSVLSTVLNNLVAAGLIKLLSTPTEASTLTEDSARDFAATLLPTVCFFAETSTQLAVYNLMLEAQRTVAHSVIAAYLEHAHSYHCQAEHLMQIAHHYMLSDNCKKKLEYLARTAEHHAAGGEVNLAVQKYSDMLHLAMGVSVEELVMLCRDREIAVLVGLESLLPPMTSSSQQSGCNGSSKVASTAHSRSAKKSAGSHGDGEQRRSAGRNSVLHSLHALRRDLFPNQVAVLDIQQDQQRTFSATQQRGWSGTSAKLSSGGAGAIAVPLQLLIDNDTEVPEAVDYASMSLADVLVRRKVIERTIAALKAAGVPVAAAPQVELVQQMAVRSQVSILGVSLVQAAEWVSKISDLLSRSGRHEEGMECAALSLLLAVRHCSDLRVQQLLNSAVLPTTNGLAPSNLAPSKLLSLQRLPLSQRAQNGSGWCTSEADSDCDEREYFDAHTMRALRFLDAQAGSYHTQQKRAGVHPSPEASTWLQRRGWMRLFNAARAFMFPPSHPSQYGDGDHDASNVQVRSLSHAPRSAESKDILDDPLAKDDDVATHLIFLELNQLLLSSHHLSQPKEPRNKANKSRHTDSRDSRLSKVVVTSMLALAKQCLIAGEPESAIVLVEELLLAADRSEHVGAEEPTVAAWALLSVAFRSALPQSMDVSYRCLQRAQELACVAGWCYELEVAAAWHLSASGQVRQAVKVLDRAMSLVPVDQVLELRVQRCWLQLLAGEVTAVSEELSALVEMLHTLSLHRSEGDGAFLHVHCQLHELHLLLQITYPSSAAALCVESHSAASDTSSAHDCDSRALQILLRYKAALSATPAPPTSASVEVSIESLMSVLVHSALFTTPSEAVRTQFDSLSITVATMLPHAQRRSLTLLPAAVVECLSLWCSMKEMLLLVTTVTVVDLETHVRSSLLDVLAVLSLNLAQVGTLSQANFTALKPFRAMLCVQHELLVQRVFSLLCASAVRKNYPSEKTSTCAAAAMDVLQCLHEHVFSTGIFKVSVEGFDACPDTPIRMKPIPQYDDFAGHTSSWRWPLVDLLGCAGSRTAVINTDSNAADLRHSAYTYRPPAPPAIINAALAEYRKGLTIPKLHKLRAYLDKSTNRDAQTRDVDPFAELCTIISSDESHICGEYDDSSGTEDTHSTVEPRHTHSGSADSNLYEIVHQSIKSQAPAQSSALLTVNISAGNTTASAADLDIGTLDHSNHRSQHGKSCLDGKCEMFAFLRPIFDDLCGQIDAAEEEAQEELCQYIAKLMDRMQN